jgi:hypothetical protein
VSVFVLRFTFVFRNIAAGYPAVVIVSISCSVSCSVRTPPKGRHHPRSSAFLGKKNVCEIKEEVAASEIPTEQDGGLGEMATLDT